MKKRKKIEYTTCLGQKEDQTKFSEFGYSFTLGRSERRPEGQKSESLPKKKFHFYLGPETSVLAHNVSLDMRELSPEASMPSPLLASGSLIPLIAPCSPNELAQRGFQSFISFLVLWVIDRKCTLLFPWWSRLYGENDQVMLWWEIQCHSDTLSTLFCWRSSSFVSSFELH